MNEENEKVLAHLSEHFSGDDSRFRDALGSVFARVISASRDGVPAYLSVDQIRALDFYLRTTMLYVDKTAKGT